MMITWGGLFKPRHRTRRKFFSPNEERSPEWNAWRERQALGRISVRGQIRPAPPKKYISRAEHRKMKDSTRAKRARADREAKLHA